MNELLKIQDLKTYFFTYEGIVKAVDGVSLKLKKGEGRYIITIFFSLFTIYNKYTL